MKNANYSTEHLAFLRKNTRRKIFVNLARIALLAALFGVWELCAATELADPFITSSPSRVWKTLADLYGRGTLFTHIGITLTETLAGFAIAVAVGYTVAVALWCSDSLHKILEPYIVILNALPKIALGPLIIIWMGTGYTSIIFMTVIVSLIVCIMNTLTGFLSADKTMLTLMKSMGAGKWTTLRKLIIPASLPQLMNTLKVAVGLAWIGSVMGEYISSSAGLGYLINYGGQVFKLDLVMTSTLILCALAGAMYGIIVLIEKMLIK